MLFTVCRKQKEAAVAAHQQFHSKLGDHVSDLNLYRAYIGLPKSQQPSWCQEHFVSARSLHKATDIYQQLHQQLTNLGLPITSAGPEVELVLKALVAGLFTNAARRQPNGTVLSPAVSVTTLCPGTDHLSSDVPKANVQYLQMKGASHLQASICIAKCVQSFRIHQNGTSVHAYALSSDVEHCPALRRLPLFAGTYQVVTSGQAVTLHPSSVLFGVKPSCVVFNEIVWTTKQYMVAVSAVEQPWLHECGSNFFVHKSQGMHV